MWPNTSFSMDKGIARAHCETLVEWASLYERGDLPGGEEAAFLLQRAARQIAKASELTIADLPPEPRPRDVPVDDVKAD